MTHPFCCPRSPAQICVCFVVFLRQIYILSIVSNRYFHILKSHDFSASSAFGKKYEGPLEVNHSVTKEKNIPKSSGGNDFDNIKLDAGGKCDNL